jgi:transcriptional regulator with XRE-family HTH domain
MTSDPSSQLWSDRPFEVEPGAVRAGLGRRLRAVRQRRVKLTLAEFGRQVAELAGRRRVFSNVTVANWESGRQEPNFATLQAIARLADLPLAYFAGVGDMDEFPRVNWFAETEHANDSRLRESRSALQSLPDPQRRIAISALTGLLEGLEKAVRNGSHSSDSDDS